jgi:hypothetical protein
MGEGECHGTHTKIVQRGANAEMHTLIGTPSQDNRPMGGLPKPKPLTC